MSDHDVQAGAVAPIRDVAQHLKPLTALPFFAAMWVVLFDYWPNLAGDAGPRFIANGRLGVVLFFVLSGFILSHVYLVAFGERRFRYLPFLWARLARVYPLHLATLIVIGLMVAAAAMAGVSMTHTVVAWSALPANLLLVHAWGVAPTAGWNHPSWSISAEWFAYLLFPTFAWVAWRMRDRAWLAVGGAILFASVLYSGFEALMNASLTNATVAWGALRIVPCFTLGCAIYLLWRRGIFAKAWQARVGVSLSLISLLVTAQLDAPMVVIIATFGCLILSLASLSSTGSNLFSGPLWVYLGEISYSVYMVTIPWQLLFVNGARRAFGVDPTALPPLLWAVLVVGVVPVAAIAHHVVERPFRVTMRRWGQRWLGSPKIAVASQHEATEREHAQASG